MWEAVGYAVGFVFTVGFSWATVRLTQKQTTKDLNGVRKVTNERGDQNDSRYMAMSLAVMMIAPEKDKAAVAAILNEGMKK